jgi:hypothetical protein
VRQHPPERHAGRITSRSGQIASSPAHLAVCRACHLPACSSRNRPSAARKRLGILAALDQRVARRGCGPRSTSPRSPRPSGAANRRWRTSAERAEPAGAGSAPARRLVAPASAACAIVDPPAQPGPGATVGRTDERHACWRAKIETSLKSPICTVWPASWISVYLPRAPGASDPLRRRCSCRWPSC